MQGLSGERLTTPFLGSIPLKPLSVTVLVQPLGRVRVVNISLLQLLGRQIIQSPAKTPLLSASSTP